MARLIRPSPASRNPFVWRKPPFSASGAPKVTVRDPIRAEMLTFRPNAIAEVSRAGIGDLVAIFCAGAYGASASPAHFLGQGPAREMLV